MSGEADPGTVDTTDQEWICDRGSTDASISDPVKTVSDTVVAAIAVTGTRTGVPASAVAGMIEVISVVDVTRTTGMIGSPIEAEMTAAASRGVHMTPLGRGTSRIASDTVVALTTMTARTTESGSRLAQTVVICIRTGSGQCPERIRCYTHASRY
mmetsp:Transcript_97017/g.259218  ORF Transcript_97017/g.259218 Transcript_97017/m.259218 type:complete len:155 (+) Transcript_97017:56-520(+)